MPQLTYYEREQIESFKRRNWPHRKIARELSRDHKCINDEVKRNSSPYLKYTAHSAQCAYELRKRFKYKRKLEKYENKELCEHVIEKICKDWSPEQISGHLKKYDPLGNGKTISHESIYQYIYNGEGKYKQLFVHLRNKQYKRKPKQTRKIQTKIKIENRISIHERPEIVKEKNRIGDWEDDSMLFSKQKTVLAVQHERSSLLCRIQKLPDKTAEEHENAVITSIESLPIELWKTITRDNGMENVKHCQTLEIFGIQSYFCDNYASWQKGGVENTNKLIRQYLPRKTNMSKISNDDIHFIQERLNNRPRKKLNYLTPNEFIATHLEKSNGGEFTS